MSTNFTFIDDVITIPYKSLESSDSASFSDQVSLIYLDSVLDSNIFTDIAAISAVLSSNDSGSASESVLGLLLDGLQDTSVLSELVNSIFVDGLSDQATLNENVIIQTELSSLDSDGFLLESSNFVAADAPGTESFVGTEFPYILAELSTTDIANLLENIPSIGITASDQSIFSELSVSIAPSVTDSGDLTESTSSEVNSASSDSSSLSDQPSIEIVAEVNDSLTSSDELSSLEISAVGSEQAQLSESVFIQVIMAASDSSIVGEINNGFMMSVKETANLIETPFYHADYARLDYVFLISEIGKANVLKEDFDSFVVTDSSVNIALNGLQLITFKERTGIGKSAPIILNINDNPTIHGTVTGDIISISTGGTEPVLL